VFETLKQFTGQSGESEYRYDKRLLVVVFFCYAHIELNKHTYYAEYHQRRI
jgi:hypothetical protein